MMVRCTKDIYLLQFPNKCLPTVQSPMKTTTSFQTWNAICQILAISHIQCCHIKQLIKDITMNIVTFSSLIYKAKYILYKHATPYISKLILLYIPILAVVTFTPHPLSSIFKGFHVRNRLTDRLSTIDQYFFRFLKLYFS